MDRLLGSLFLFAGSYAPRGAKLCNGELQTIAQNPALFSILGTMYGGNGTTTFALPDLTERAPIHSTSGVGTATDPVRPDRGSRDDVSLPGSLYMSWCIVVDGTYPSRS